MRAVTTWIAPITFTSIWTPSKKLPLRRCSRRRFSCEKVSMFSRCPVISETTGSKGVHVYIPIERGPSQKQVWTFSKRFAQALAAQYSSILTAEYRIARRPKGRILVDYNQNAWGRTLASIYSVRPRPKATVSTPVTWREVERGVRIEDFTIRNIPARVAKLGDLWAPLLEKRGRFSLEKFV